MADDSKQQAAEEKITIGGVEYQTQEVDDLMGAGKRLKELEEKQGQPVDDILKSWGRRGEEIGNYKKQVEELTGKLTELSKPPKKEGEALTEAEIEAQVKAEAKKYGLLTSEEARELATEIYNNNRAGERLLARTNRVLKEAKKDGRPVVETEKLLEFMADPNNPKDPQNAYEIMFKKELKDWEKTQVGKLKNKGMVTDTSATGNKEPERKTIVGEDALKSALAEHFANWGK